MSNSPASHRLRIGRHAEPDRIYLLTSNTHQRKPFFRDFALGRLVANQFDLAQKQGHVNSLAWVVMPDHFHWLIELKIGSLGELMQRTKSLSTKAVNQSIGGKINLWQKGFYDQALRQEEELVKLARYVVANPLRAGLVEKLSDYPLWDAIWAKAKIESSSSLAG
ncbi:transposase [Pseudomonas kribbensis]|uniref:Transposase n=1 Tax=Pseudomonas kribbensis TaxID=1628086 RepID=A0A345RMP3_9PSED|nr:transposase [Pseudomonas kribbensis]AXI60559.1 transposase [Pseudomonas kribbensis]